MRGQWMAAALAAALVIVVAVPPVQGKIPGYWDTTLEVIKGKGREPLLIDYGGSLWCIYQYRTELRDVGMDQPGRRSDIYYSILNASVGNGPARTGNVSDWSTPVSLVPGSQDVNGHGVHGPYASVYKGKLYVTMEAVEPSIKDDDAKMDYDIILRVFDGSFWDPPLEQPARVISERNDVNVSDTECRSITFRETLHFVWDQVPVDEQAGSTPRLHTRDIVYRTYDGAAWGSPSVAAAGNGSVLGVPSVAVYKDRLWVSFQTNTSEGDDMDILVISWDGASWSAPGRVNPAVEGSPLKRQNMNARLAVLGDRLYCAWQSADAIAKSGRDYDILVSSTDGASGWSEPFEVNPPGDSDAAATTGQDKAPDIKAWNGSLHIAWASNNTRINDGGEDYDIMLRSFDGTAWGPMIQVSPAGDNGTIAGDHNRGDDETPRLHSWNGSLYCTWISYDQEGVGHKGGNPSVIARRVRGPDPGTPGDDFPGTGSGGTGPSQQFPWAVAGVLVVAAAVAAAAIVLWRPPREDAPGCGRTEKDNSRKGKD
ncbi:MAG: hypothetical protein FJ149_01500 [Euryarchaeota archaeon]|nr:hypothetical protein [Euryarchaeota archaeon]